MEDVPPAYTKVSCIRPEKKYKDPDSPQDDEGGAEDKDDNSEDSSEGKDENSSALKTSYISALLAVVFALVYFYQF